MTKREKGVETTSCPTCDSDLKAMKPADDGAVAFETCTSCYDTKAPKPADAPPNYAELASETRETGSN